LGLYQYESQRAADGDTVAPEGRRGHFDILARESGDPDSTEA
jgi:hypothetical protein